MKIAGTEELDLEYLEASCARIEGRSQVRAKVRIPREEGDLTG
ncbi:MULTISPECIES: hypothetical protein [Actinomycetes]|nr:MULTISPECIES: hypothetical protein [Actinomycetes]